MLFFCRCCFVVNKICSFFLRFLAVFPSFTLKIDDYTWGDSDVVLSAIINAAMLQQYNVVVNLRLLACRLYASRNARSANNLGKKNGQIFACNAVFVHVKYTSNMAACCGNDVNDITSPHVYGNAV